MVAVADNVIKVLSVRYGLWEVVQWLRDLSQATGGRGVGSGEAAICERGQEAARGGIVQNPPRWELESSESQLQPKDATQGREEEEERSLCLLSSSSWQLLGSQLARGPETQTLGKGREWGGLTASEPTPVRADTS